MLRAVLILSVVVGAAQAAAAIGRYGTMERREVTVTVRAGERVTDVWSQFEGKGLATRKELLRIAAGEPFPSYPVVPAPRRDPGRFEGLFAAGQYRVVLAVDPAQPEHEQAYQRSLQLLSVLLEAGQKRLEKYGCAEGLSLYQTAILASIVEKEDVPRREYAEVASVFLNRLAQGMGLASCPTLEYSLGYHRAFLLSRDVAVDTPYNTYLHLGLPPTPICFFSDQALAAVVHPVSTGYYFFVLDWALGRIYFAQSYAEHLSNVRQARQDFVRRYGARRLFTKQVGKFYQQ